MGLYIHRSGRTGRAGKNGISISIINTREFSKIAILERQTGKKFIRKMIPDGKEVCEKQLFNLIDKVVNVEVEGERIQQFLPDIYDKLSSLDREDLIKHFVSVEFNRFLSYYKDSQNINTISNLRHDSPIGRNRDVEFARFNINLGAKQNVTPSRIIGIINDKLRSRDVYIGKIQIQDKFSTFDIDKRFEKQIISSFANAKYDNKLLIVELIQNNNNFQKSIKKRRR